MQDWRCTLPHKGFRGHQGTRHMQRMCPWVCPPLSPSRIPPSQADFSCSHDKSHLMSSGRTHLSKGYGVNSWLLSPSCESISSSQLCALLGAGSVAPLSSSPRLFLLLLSSKGPSVVTFPLCPERRLSESALPRAEGSPSHHLLGTGSALQLQNSLPKCKSEQNTRVGA